MTRCWRTRPGLRACPPTSLSRGPDRRRFAGRRPRVHCCASSSRTTSPSTTSTTRGRPPLDVGLSVPEPARATVDRLIGGQWPDGGGTATSDSRPAARRSRSHRSPPGLWAYGHTRPPTGPGCRPEGDRPGAGATASVAPARRRAHRPGLGRPPGPDPIRDPVLRRSARPAGDAELGRLSDTRCADALALLEPKQLPDGRFPMEQPNGGGARADRRGCAGSAQGKHPAHPVKRRRKDRCHNPGAAGVFMWTPPKTHQEES